ncbi:hypothetical protein [Streptomyces sp. ok210]|jgi:hypothetical protein|uniref:hypothetical protein n=1 Tax=Streptomyces sp. ok210 TaxID=1761905 RepID=UPI0008EFD402|nr:hypothetical protein [Streptomyces sp. ok210]SFT22241.1 hypothetical protein SAMN04487982_110178 [Streptomyces sp. ok210]
MTTGVHDHGEGPAIRAARSGVCNLTGVDLRSLRLSDPHQAVSALRGLGWQLDDVLLNGDADTPVAVTVPGLAVEDGGPLPFGKNMRSRVSGWTTRVLAAKPVKKTTPATRFAALFLAAHSSPKCQGELPPHLPEACHAALPELRSKGFLADLTGNRYRLDPAVRHLAGMLHNPADPRDPAGADRPAQRAVRPAIEQPRVSPAEWEQWKKKASPALRRHVEAVEHCALCALPSEQVATALTASAPTTPAPRFVRSAYGEWKEAHPDRGPLAARFTVVFRAEHGHGPSYSQLCAGLGWDLPRTLRSYVVRRLLANEWLTDTSPVPWTLRPGSTAQAHGITLQA